MLRCSFRPACNYRPVSCLPPIQPTQVSRGHTEMFPKSLNLFWFPPGWGQRWVHLSRVFAWHCCCVADPPLPGVGGQAASQLRGEVGHFILPFCLQKKLSQESWKPFKVFCKASWLWAGSSPTLEVALFPLGWSRVVSPLPLGILSMWH